MWDSLLWFDTKSHFLNFNHILFRTWCKHITPILKDLQYKKSIHYSVLAWTVRRFKTEMYLFSDMLLIQKTENAIETHWVWNSQVSQYWCLNFIPSVIIPVPAQNKVKNKWLKIKRWLIYPLKCTINSTGRHLELSPCYYSGSLRASHLLPISSSAHQCHRPIQCALSHWDKQ